jgi:hypothetical protein
MFSGLTDGRIKCETPVPIPLDSLDPFTVLAGKSSVLHVSDVDFLGVGKIPLAPVPQLVFGNPHHNGHTSDAVRSLLFHLSFLLSP